MKVVSLLNPPVFLSGLLGATLVMFFSGRCMTAVGVAAQEVVRSVRDQVHERPGILDGTEKPDYQRCVAIVTAAAQREMVLPGLVATVAPPLSGFTWRLVGSSDPSNRLLG